MHLIFLFLFNLPGVRYTLMLKLTILAGSCWKGLLDSSLVRQVIILKSKEVVAKTTLQRAHYLCTRYTNGYTNGCRTEWLLDLGLDVIEQLLYKYPREAAQAFCAGNAGNVGGGGGQSSLFSQSVRFQYLRISKYATCSHLSTWLKPRQTDLKKFDIFYLVDLQTLRRFVHYNEISFSEVRERFINFQKHFTAVYLTRHRYLVTGILQILICVG